ncbi:MAG: YHS domain-containing protein, partial [Candidatus Angelobacter sp.]
MNPEKINSEETKSGTSIVKDPVCNMDVDPATARGSAEYKGQTYYFCSAGCVTRFKADPEKYLAPKAPKVQLPKSQMVQIGGIALAPSPAKPSPERP